MTDTLSTGWADVEASILADSAAGLSIPKIAARCGWGRQTVAVVEGAARHANEMGNLKRIAKAINTLCAVGWSP